MDDGEYYSSGDPPIPVALPPGGSPDCEIGVAPPITGAVDRRAPLTPSSARSTTPARGEREPSAITDERGPSAATDEIEPVAFKTVGCERNAGE